MKNLKLQFTSKETGETFSPVAVDVSIDSEKNIDYAYVIADFFEDYMDFKPIKYGDSLVITANGETKFRGIVTSVPRRREGVKISYEFECESFWSRSKTLLVNKTYNNKLISDIVTDLINEYSVRTNITPGKIDATTVPLEQIEFIEEPLFNVIEKLSKMIGFFVKINRSSNTLDFERYLFSQNYLSVQEENIVRGTGSFVEDSSRLVNRIVIFGDADEEGNEVKTTVQDDASIDKYGLIEDTVRISDTTSIDALKEYGDRHLEIYSKILQMGQVQVMEDRGWSPGELVEVHLPTLNLDGDMLRITRIRKEYPPMGDEKTTLFFNEQPDVGVVMSQINNRLKQFEKKQERWMEKTKNKTMKEVQSSYYDKETIDYNHYTKPEVDALITSGGSGGDGGGSGSGFTGAMTTGQITVKNVAGTGSYRQIELGIKDTYGKLIKEASDGRMQIPTKGKYKLDLELEFSMKSIGSTDFVRRNSDLGTGYDDALIQFNLTSDSNLNCDVVNGRGYNLFWKRGQYGNVFNFTVRISAMVTSYASVDGDSFAKFYLDVDFSKISSTGTWTSQDFFVNTTRTLQYDFNIGGTSFISQISSDTV